LAAPGVAPELTGNPELAVRMHESLVNNLAQGLLAGETVGQKWIEETALDLLGKVPPGLKDDPDKEPWTMTLADQRPVTFIVADGGFKLTVRGKSYTSGDRKFDAMDFTIKYRLERDGKALKAVREGSIEIFPPGFVQGRDRLALPAHAAGRVEKGRAVGSHAIGRRKGLADAIMAERQRRAEGCAEWRDAVGFRNLDRPNKAQW